MDGRDRRNCNRRRPHRHPGLSGSPGRGVFPCAAGCSAPPMDEHWRNRSPGAWCWGCAGRAGPPLGPGAGRCFPGPGSFTGEDCAEFHCHGSPVVLRELLCALFAAGARQARAGEFTRRAFLNGRLDLTEAEAVIDLIDAQTAAAARNAAAQLEGGLRRVLEPIQESCWRLPPGFTRWWTIRTRTSRTFTPRRSPPPFKALAPP